MDKKTVSQSRTEQVQILTQGNLNGYRRLFGGKLVGAEKPDGVNSTLDLMTPEGRESCIRSAKKLRDMGAGVIALACTGMTTIGIAETLEAETGLPVIDPVLAEGLFAYFESIRHR